MPPDQGYYRHPTIHGDTIVFVCEDDLWSVPVEGGIARRLTANPGTCSFPLFSPDGSRIGFTGRDDGPTEIYVMDAEGGVPSRLTWLGVFAQTAAWTPEGKAVVFASDWRKPFMKDISLYSVSTEGGPVSVVKNGAGRAISYQPDGEGVVLGRNSGDPARWKRYKGGTAGTLWCDRNGSGAFSPLVRLEGNLASPMWIGARIYFLSDHEGYGNLYSCTPTGRDLRRHTHREDYYVRYPSTDGRRIVYHSGADIFVFDPKSKTESRVPIRLTSPRSQRNRKFVPAARYMESFDLHPQGHSLASVHRGGLYTMGLWESAPLRHGEISKARYRLASWLPDGKRVVAVTDEGGEESLIVFRTAEETEPPKEGTRPARGRAAARPTVAEGDAPRKIDGDFGRVVELAVAPGGADRVALTNQRYEVILVDLKNGRAKVIERSRHMRCDGLAWSADGRWLAYGFPDSNRTSCLHLCDTSNGEVSAITRSGFYDLRPSFDPDGKYLYFISLRVYDPIYDSIYFDLGFPKGSRPYLIPLRRDIASPFSAANRPLRAPGCPGSDLAGQESMEARKKEEAPKVAPKVEIDLEGIEDRVTAFPVPEGIYVRVHGARNRVFFTSQPAEGSLEMTWYPGGEPPAKATLQVYNLEEDKTETVLDRVTGFTLSQDSKVLGLRIGNRVRVLPIAYKADGKPVKDEAGRETGWVDLDRLRVSVDPAAEWRQMFREAWRLQRDQFWTASMSGHDWKGVHDRYLPLVDRVSSRAEFSDLMWEMQGELGTSHCYEMGGEYRPEPTWYSGFFGADIEWDARRRAWRVVRIPQGDSWDEKRLSPLAAPGLNVKVNDEILAVGGLTVDRMNSPYACLVNQAGREVALTIRTPAAPARRGARRPAAQKEVVRTVVIKTLREEYSLRYRDWVETNRAWVHKNSNGRVGYVHIPNMGPLGYSEFHRYFLSEAQHEGLLVDVRYNGGGHVSQLLLEKLLRRRIGYDANRWGTPEPYPTDSPMGPMVALTNEYAGSDGDIFSHCFKLYGLGPLIGKRTWGGVVGIWPRHTLVDGTVTTQPEFAFWFQDVGWGVENYGTDPDIEVEIKPQDWAAGRDPQMERALVEVEKLIKKLKPRLPEFKDRPRINPPRLPKVE